MIIIIYHCQKMVMGLVDNFDHMASYEGNIKIFDADSIKADGKTLRLYQEDRRSGRKIKAIIDSRLYTYFDIV